MQADYDAAPNRRTAAQPVKSSVQYAIWIMLSTLFRVDELSMTRWEYVNLDTGEWYIPKENVKGNLIDFAVYLFDFSTDQFRRLHAITGLSAWCFPARNREGMSTSSNQIGDGTRCSRSIATAPREYRGETVATTTDWSRANGRSNAWTPHDLRRTGAAMMKALGVSLYIIDRCWNHVLAGSRIAKIR